MARFNATRQLETTFGNGGIVILREDIATDTEAGMVVFQPDGNIVALRHAASSGSFLARLWR